MDNICWKFRESRSSRFLRIRIQNLYPDPDHHQNLIDLSLGHTEHVHQMLLKLIKLFLRKVAQKITDPESWPRSRSFPKCFTYLFICPSVFVLALHGIITMAAECVYARLHARTARWQVEQLRCKQKIPTNKGNKGIFNEHPVAN